MQQPFPPATLAPTALIDSDHPAVREFASTQASGATPRARAIALFYAVRDGFRYDPYRIDLSTRRMRELMQTAVFHWHGYAEIWLEGAWRKATPAFNRELCERFDLLPLDFNGVDDSLYHPFDRQGNRHMEYIDDHGAFDDVPLARLIADFARYYPGWAPRMVAEQRADFLRDVDLETGAPPAGKNPA